MTEFAPEPSATAPPPADSVAPRDSTASAPTSVSRLNETINGFVQRWGSVWVAGEITGWNARGGHVFGRLKDTATDAHLSFRIWSSTLQRLTDQLGAGDQVIACVKPDYFVKGGDFSFTVSSMSRAGLGAQLERLEALRAALRAEGLFDPAQKKRLPFLPNRIGLITGERSDAEKDVHRIATLRWPAVQFRTVHVAVQGDRCAPETAAAIGQLDADPDVDVIIVARGGGDAQALLGFSDERVLRAAFACTTPLVSAIGHENDRPLLDEVADVRAATPTDAAKRVVPDVAEQHATIAQLRSRITTRLSHRISADITQLEQLRSRPVLRAPDGMLTGRAQEVFLLSTRARDSVDRTVAAYARQTGELRAALTALSPGATLARGYAIAHRQDGTIVRDADQAPSGTRVAVTVARGSFAAVSDGEIAEDGGEDPDA